jgi:hypothetical protein
MKGNRVFYNVGNKVVAIESNTPSHNGSGHWRGPTKRKTLRVSRFVPRSLLLARKIARVANVETRVVRQHESWAESSAPQG